MPRAVFAFRALLVTAAAAAAAPTLAPAAAPVVNITQPISFELTQGSFTTQVQAVERAEDAAAFYDYFSASSHTEFEVPHESKVFLYRDTTTGLLSLFITHNIDLDTSGIFTGNGSVTFDLDGVPASAFVAQSDDPMMGLRAELDLDLEPEGDWSYSNNTDGGVVGGLPTNAPWCITITPLLFVNIDNWVYHFASGASIPLDMSEPVTICFVPSPVIDVLEIDEGNEVSLAGSFDDSDPLDGHMASWDFGDSTTGNATFSPGVGFTHHEVDPVFHTYGDDGDYTSVLTVADSSGLVGDDSVTVSVSNVAPTVDAGGPYTTSIGTSFTVVGTASDPGSDDLTFEWDFGDGSGIVPVTYFNDGGSPDPPMSPAGEFPFFATDVRTHAFCEVGTFTVTLTVHDDDLGEQTDTATVSVAASPPGTECNQPPVCTAGTDIVADCDGVQLDGRARDPDGDPVTFEWSAPCAVTFTPSANVPNPVVTFGSSCDQTCEIMLFVSDGQGGSCEDTVVVSVDDETAPSIAGVPADASVACDAVPAVPAGVSAADSCDPSPSLAFEETRADGACLDSYVLTRTWTATDACVNVTIATQTIDVSDTVEPTLSGVPGDATVPCDAVPAAASPSATDNCDPDPDIDFTEVRADGPCEDTYTLTRTWTATDRCGNDVSATQVLTVQDTQPPVLAGVPGDMTVECDAVPAAASPSATDSCDPVPDIDFAEVRADGPCEDTYTLTRTWTATDRCGNDASQAQVLTVQDTQPPVLAGVPGDITVECDAVPDPAMPTATDNCDPSPEVTLSETTVAGPCPGSYVLTRTWTATDRCLNASTATQVVTVQDTTPPVVTPDEEEKHCTWPPNHRYVCFARSDFSPVISDACSEPVTWVIVGCASDQPDDGLGDGHTTEDCVVDPSGESFCVRSERQGGEPLGRHYAVTIVATDACGNSGEPVGIGTIYVPHDQSPRRKDCRQ